MSINVEVELRERESIERLIRRFIKKVKKEGILEEYNDRQFYKKKSDLKRIKKRRRKKIAQDVQREKNTKIDNRRLK